MAASSDGVGRSRVRWSAHAARWLVLLAALATGALAGRPAAAEGESAAALLDEARALQVTRGDPRGALVLYEDVLRLEKVEPRQRGLALAGAAECHATLGEWREADAKWEEIARDESIPREVREGAELVRKRFAKVSRPPAPPADGERTAEEVLAEQERRRHAEVESLLDQASADYRERKFDDAYERVEQALRAEPDNERALALLERVQQERPDRGALVASLFRWYETAKSEAFHRLRAHVQDVEQEALKRWRGGDLRGADLRFREAIALVDRSDFRAELERERENLLAWLAQVAAEGRAQGLDFAPEPAAPPRAPAGLGLKGRFQALLSEAFSGRDAGTDPIRFHEFVPPPAPDGRPRRSLGPNQFASRAIATEQTGSPLTRARWAERWIRRNVGGGDWPTRTGPAAATPGRRPGPAAAPRLLERLGDTLFVQHTEAVQREIDALRASFATAPVPLDVDVSAYASGPNAGTVRITTALRLPPPPRREPGLASVAGSLRIDECRRELDGLEDVTLLGHARLRLSGDVAARLDVTERTEAHPLHAQPQPPPLAILGLDPARYGLFLDVYAEDLPHAPGPAREAALSVSARVRLPLPSVVVRTQPPAGTHKPEDEWTRLPKFAETVVEGDERLAHAATLVLFGLPNPFVDSAERFPNLVLLVAVRPSGGPAPDPPARVSTKPEAQDVPLGTLASEVLDDMVVDGWPEDRSAAQPVADAVARRARDDYLAMLLASRARLLSATGANPVTVHDGLASAVLGERDRVLLEAEAARLASQETALYEVDVRAVEAPPDLADAWAARKDVHLIPDAATGPGGAGTDAAAYLVPAGLVPVLDVELQRLEKAPSLYTLVGRHAARATQQVVLRRLATQSYTRQVRVARHAADGRPRLVAVPGMAEEGLIVQVRPGLEDEGRRTVSVRVRAARLRVVEGVPLKGVDAPGLVVDVPRWHPFQDKSTGGFLADGEALLVRLPVPEDPARALLVRVTTRKVQ